MTISTSTSVCPSVLLPLSVRKLTPIPAGLSQNSTHNSYLVPFEGENHAFGVSPRSLESTRHSGQPQGINIKVHPIQKFCHNKKC